MSPLVVCLLAAGVFAASIVNGPQQGDLRFNQWHHEYAGLAACGVGVLLHSDGLQIVGMVLTIDDATQHLYQRMNHDLTIRSPIHIGYQLTIGKVVEIQRLSAWLDKVLR